MLMRHDKCSVKTELLMQNSYNLPMRGIFWCSYLGEEIYSTPLCLDLVGMDSGATIHLNVQKISMKYLTNGEDTFNV